MFTCIFVTFGPWHVGEILSGVLLQTLLKSIGMYQAVWLLCFEHFLQHTMMDKMVAVKVVSVPYVG